MPNDFLIILARGLFGQLKLGKPHMTGDVLVITIIAFIILAILVLFCFVHLSDRSENIQTPAPPKMNLLHLDVI